jgi:ribosome-binding factor A
MDQHRAARVSETLKEELSEMIGYELSDPRLGTVDVIDVVVAPDMRHARVIIQAGGGDRECAEALRALDGARGYLRREVACRLRLFRIPELHFEAGMTADSGSRMERLLKRVRKGRPRVSEAPEKTP